MQRAIENPLTISITGDENSDKVEDRKSSIIQNLLNLYKEELPAVFNNINPDELEFEMLTLSMRIHIDMGDKVMGMYLGALTCLYLLLGIRGFFIFRAKED